MADKDNMEQVVVPFPKKGTLKESERKWGKTVMDQGFCIVPSLLFRAQQRLGLNATQLAIIMHLADFWWEQERKPYPSKATIGERLGLSSRQVQRHIAELEKAGLLQRIERKGFYGKQSNYYDLSGLVNRLQQLAPEFREVKNETKKMKRAVARRGFRRKKEA